MSDAPSPAPPPTDRAAAGAKLVRASRWLLSIGLVTCFAGCGVGIAARSGILAAVGAALGFGVIVTAAVVGQVGRAQQGRII